MSKRSMDFKMKMPPQVTPNIETAVKPGTNVLGTIAKWVPLICAGAAVGVSVIALKEIHNMRKDLAAAKSVPKANEELKVKMESMEAQLKQISEYLKTKPPTSPPPTKQSSPPPTKSTTPSASVVHKKSTFDEVIKNAVEGHTAVNIINGNEKFDSNIYEEVEVTDSESED